MIFFIHFFLTDENNCIKIVAGSYLQQRCLRISLRLMYDSFGQNVDASLGKSVDFVQEITMWLSEV